MRRRGFTLVELLAVIVILAIILAIAIPTISNMINSSTKSTFESSAKLVLKGIEYKMLEDSTFDPTSITESNIETSLNIDDSNYKSITVKKVNDVLHITIVGQNKWDKYTVSGTKAITKVEDTVTSFTGGANKPALVTGMTPIKWDSTENKWVDTTESDSEWYSYTTTDKKWANARTEDGSMWVWIPRYIYKITSYWHGTLPVSAGGIVEVQFSKGVDDNWNKAVIGAIDLREGAEASNAATNGNKYTNHPAFTFGDTELTGIWVAKFEASGTADTITFVPNVTANNSLSIGEAFTATRNMETNDRYGWEISGNGIDTHMVKNTEWAAVAYLAQSTYGKNAALRGNNTTTYITGCTYTTAGYVGCEYSYETTTGAETSTTGNIYGIYDTFGGSREWVPIYVENGNTNLTTYGGSIINADSKYKTIYQLASVDTSRNNFDLTIRTKGDALYETGTFVTPALKSWYLGTITMPSTSNVWCARGKASIAPFSMSSYAISCSNGMAAAGNSGIRATLVVGAGL